MRLIILDDTDNNARLLVTPYWFADSSFEIHRVSTVDDAAAYLTSHSVDAVLLDQGLPENAVIQALDLINARFSTLPIVVIRQKDDPAAEGQAFAHGAQDYLYETELTPSLLIRSFRSAIVRKRFQATVAPATEIIIDENPHENESDYLTLLQAAVQQSYDAIIITNTNHVITFVNQGFTRLTGYSSDEAIGTSPMRYVGVNTETDTLAQAAKKSWGEPHTHTRIEIQHKDGAQVIVEWSAAPIRSKTGEITSYVTIARDVTERERAETALRANKERYYTLLEGIDSIIAVFAADGQIMYANTSAAKGLGTTPDELIGKNMHDVFPPSLAEQQLANIRRVIESAEGIINEAPSLFQDEVRWYRTSIQPVRDASGKVTFALVNAIDVTAIRQTSDALRASEAKFRGLMETAPEAVIIANAAGQIVLINEQAQSLFGYRPDELTGKSIEFLVPEANRQAHIHQRIEYMQDPNARHRNTRIVMQAQHKNRNIIPIEIGFGYLSVDGNKIVVCFVTEITERVQAQTTLRYQANLLNQVSDAIIATDASLKITAWNNAASLIYGWTESEALGQNVDQLLKTEWLEDTKEKAQAVVINTGQWHGEVSQHTKSGRRLYVMASVSLMHENGRMTGGVTVNRDITARKRHEVLQTHISQTLEAIADGHDIVNILRMLALAVEEFEPEMKVSVLLLDRSTETLHHGVAPSLPQAYTGAIDGFHMGAGAGSCGTAAYEKRLVIVEDIATHPYWVRFRDLALTHRLRACWSQPILDADSSVLGTFAIYYDHPCSPTATELDLIRLAAHIAGIAIRRAQAEEALRASERRYRQAFMMHGMPKLIVDPKSARIVDANSAAVQFYGHDIAVLTTMEIFDLSLSPRESILSVINRVAQAELLTTTAVHRCANNLSRDVEVYAAPIDIDGKQYLYLIIADITEKKRAESALQEAHDLLEQRVIERTAELEHVKNRLEAIFNHSGDGIVLLSVTHGIQQANYAFTTLFGVAENAYSGMSLTAFVSEDDVVSIETAIGKITRTHEMRTLEVRAKRGDGTFFDAEISLAPVNRSEGAITNVVCIIRDATERQIAQRMIAEERNLLRTVIDAVPDLIYVKDRQHRMILNNEAHLRSLGKANPEDVIGKTDEELHTVDLAAKFQADDQRMFSTGQPILNLEEKTVGRDGSEIWALTTKVPLRNLDGDIIGLVGITHDITHLKESEEALRRSQADLQSVIDSTNTAFVLMDRNGVIRVANRLAQLISRAHYGYEMQIGLPMQTYIPTMLHPSFHGRFAKILTGASIVSEDTMPTGEKPRYYEFRYFPVKTADGEIIGVNAAYEDITERKDTEFAAKQKHQEELAMQEYLKALHEISIELAHTETLDEFYRTAVELGAKHLGFERIGLVVYDSEKELAHGTYGISIEGVVEDQHHLRLEKVHLPETLSQTMGRANHVTFRENVLLYQGYEVIGTGCAAAAAIWDGIQLGWLAIDNALHNTPITHVQLDILALYALTVGSLLARKRAEQTAISLTQRLDIATRSAKIGIWEWDLQTNVLDWDDQMYALYGLVRTETPLTAAALPRIVHPDDLERSQNDTYRSLNEGAAYQSDFRIIRPNGEIRHITGTGVVIFDGSGKASRMIGANWDMTALKESEKALREAFEREKELGELKSRFVSMASHEFRTPLAAILATTDTLSIYRHKMEENQIDARLEKIRQQVNHMRDITNDVLQLARIQAGRVDYVPTELDLDALCRDIVEEFESQAAYCGRNIYTCANPPVIGLYDVHLLRQVISNLISNALKYSPADTPVHIQLEHDDSQVILRVTDEGIGIPPEDQKHLFEPFHRARNVGTIPGTGLGLSIAKQSVEMHGGTIRLENANGVGTLFTVTMPKHLPLPDNTNSDSAAHS